MPNFSLKRCRTSPGRGEAPEMRNQRVCLHGERCPHHQDVHGWNPSQNGDVMLLAGLEEPTWLKLWQERNGGACQHRGDYTNGGTKGMEDR